MDPRVGGEMNNFVAVRYDADRGEGKAVAQRYGVDAYPTFVILDRNGSKIDEFAAYRPPDQMIQRLQSYRGR